MAEFLENVIDILESWDFYPKQEPNCEGGTAYNSGHVQLKCFINNVCPFYKTPKKEDALIFNSETYRELVDVLPRRITTALTATPGLEGLHFRPRKVFRHNYMYRYSPDFFDSTISFGHSLDEIFANWDIFFKDISINGTPGVVGADQTRYQAEQSWLAVPSVFDDLSCGADGVCDNNVFYEAGVKSQWIYGSQSLPVNMYSDKDVEFDYKEEYWKDYEDSFMWSNDKLILKPIETLRIDKFTVQMPVQSRVHDRDSNGIHWKIIKRTPVFKGEDFFIRFYKQSQQAVKQTGYAGLVSFNDKQYAPLDYTEEDTIKINPIADFEMKINDAIRGSDDPGDGIKNLNIYDFYSQAYYIIELNAEYFIVIPSRGFPVFIHFFRAEDTTGVVSKRMGEPFGGISGEQLINAEYFDIVVRNHLGRLAIQFEGPFGEVAPWIVERNDWVVENVPKGESPFMAEKPRDLIVPRGKIGIWGGNLRCGFIFGPLQYHSSFVSFIYPPRDTDESVGSEEVPWRAFLTIAPEIVTFSSDYFKSDPIWLPMNGPVDGTPSNHSLSLEAYSGYLEKGSIGDQPVEFTDVPLFTMDAQYYFDYHEGDTPLENKLGYFHYNMPIRDFADVESGGRVGHVKTSNITVQKYKYLNNDKTRHQGFNMYIGMMCGDHVFTDKHWFGTSPGVRPASYDIYRNTSATIADSVWYLPDCKTPIITTIRLISESSEEPRWDDNTSIEDGINRDPTKGTSSYFRDATNHVMTFSHAWTASGLTSMEHTGSIQFYLNPEVAIEGNITEDLIALQDKNFYIEIWAGYEPLTTCTEPDGSVLSNYTRIPGFYKMFTGMCQGGTISYEYGKNIMTCKLEDYSTVLKGMKFFNSPWFDGLKDVVAINEIMQFAGFRDKGFYDPGTLIKELANNAVANPGEQFHMNFDGRVFKFEPFALPSGYNRLEQPAFKFNDGDPFIDAITKIAKMSSKMFYFDEFGQAHYEDFQDMLEADFTGAVPLVPLYQFTMHPEINGGQLLFNKVERSFDVTGIYNHIKILTNTPDMHLLIRDNLKWDSLENTEVTGFLGYMRTAYQAESMFGSKEAQLATINKYAVGFKPKVKLTFETYGLPLRATDIVAVEGEIVRVTKVSHVLDASKNQWWMQVECERYQSIDASSLISD